MASKVTRSVIFIAQGRLLQRLQSRRVDPIVQVSRCIGGAARSPEQFVSLRPCWQNPSFRASILGGARKLILEDFGLFEMTQGDHGALLSVEEGGSATGVLITDKCHGPGGDGESLRLNGRNSESFFSKR